MASKNVRKIYSKSSNELVKVDMADRDGQGNVIHETYAKKAEAGGAKRYRHNICAVWMNGSGSGYVTARVFFDFIDDQSESYAAANAYNIDSFFAFLAAHCAFSRVGNSPYGWLRMNGTVERGSRVVTLTAMGFYSNSDVAHALSWYYCGTSHYDGDIGHVENYADTELIFPSVSGNFITLCDAVEAL
jgi:hypothetical protein